MSVQADEVLIDQDGRRRRASRLLVPDLIPGDWVLVAAGAVMERLDPREAEEIVATLDAAVEAEAAAAARRAARAMGSGGRT